jgi:hypothetical protein
MIDDAFLRHVAALQANLKMLESQSDALSDLADMKELRLYKSRLTEYIAAHAKAGNLPEDPFQVIARRLEPISKFFTEGKKTYERLINWKADWLKSVPAVSLADLQAARTELGEIVASNPQIQEYLRGYLSLIDFEITPSMVNMYPELLACAQCLTNLQIPYQMQERRRLYEFARNEGCLSEEISTHIAAISSRINELITLHGNHKRVLNEADAHLENHDFRKAEKVIHIFGQGRFSDLNYDNIESKLKKLKDIFRQFNNIESSFNKRIKHGRLNDLTGQLGRLRVLITKPDSELGRECLNLLQKMTYRCYLERQKKFVRNSIIVLSIIVATFLIVYFGQILVSAI